MSAIDPNEPGYGPLKDLEEQQFGVLYQSMDVPLRDIRKKSFGWFFLTGIVLLLMVICLGIFVKIPNYLEVPIVIENLEQDRVMMFNHSARVSEYMVEVGESVEAGQAICKVSSPQIQALISAIRIAENDIRALENHDSVDISLQVENIEKQIGARNARLAALNAEEAAATNLFISQRSALESELAYSKSLKDRNEGLAKEGAISQADYLESERNYLSQSDELALLEKSHEQGLQQFNMRRAEIRETLVTLRNQQEELSRGYRTDRGRLQDQIDFAEKNLELYYGAYEVDGDELVLLAPEAGTMTFCYPSNQLLQPGEILYRMESGKGEFAAKGTVEATQIGYVHTDMPAKVMLATFPHFEWGNLSGKIGRVSSSPDEEGLYSISVALSADNPRIAPLLQNGQTGECSIIFEEKSLFGYIMRDFRRVASEIVD